MPNGSAAGFDYAVARDYVATPTTLAFVTQSEYRHLEIFTSMAVDFSE